MKRPVQNGFLCVFAFLNGNNALGLDSYTKGQLVPKIYSILSENLRSVLDGLFNQAYKEVQEQKRSMGNSFDESANPIS